MCAKCGLPLGKGVRCPACANHDFAFDQARSWAAYSGELRQAILSLKHRKNPGLATELAKNLVETIVQQNWQADLLIPVPLSTERLKKRGYNQIDLLAWPMAAKLGLDFARNVLMRRHETLPQFELNAAERWKNLHGSFVAELAPLAGKRVLLVDDIMTTGATLDAAAEALKQAGAEKVYGATLARTL